MSRPLVGKCSPRNHIVFVMGSTGSGKSNFIAVAARQDGRTVVHGLESQTSDIQVVQVDHPTTGDSVVLVEIPGFDDSSKSDEEVLTVIADWLVKTYKGQLNLATLIYLHRIVDIRMSGSLQKNLKTFMSLCGQEAMPNVVIATTMWRRVWGTEGEDREARLKSAYWADMMAQGCRVERFRDTHESAWFIIDGRFEKDAKVRVSREMVDRRLQLKQTQAGITLNNELKKSVKTRKEAARKLQAQLKQKNNELVMQQLRKTQTEIDEKIVTTDRIVVVMGPTGAGKSNFIDVATGQDGHTVGHKLESETSDIRTIRVNHPTTHKPVIFVDTPGFDDSSKSDVEILSMIADWLVKTYKQKLNLTTIIYLHRIVDIRMSGSLQRNLEMFRCLCGQEAMPNAVIATTMWCRVWGAEGEEREARLKSIYWADMIAQGCRVERFQDTYESAWHIIGNLEHDMTSNEKDQRAQGVAKRAAWFKEELSRSANAEERGISRLRLWWR